MKVADSTPGNLIAIRNLFGLREFYLITKKQDNPFKVRAYKAMSGRFFYLNLNQKCKLVKYDDVA